MSKSNEIINKIFEEKERQNLTYRVLAQRLKIDPKMLVNWKSGKNGISLEMADRILKELGITVIIGK